MVLRYHGTEVQQQQYGSEKRLLKVLKALAELKSQATGEVGMKMSLAIAGLTVGVGVVIMLARHSAPAHAATEPQSHSAEVPHSLLHTHETFEFIANAPIDVAFPLFGANGERAWAPDWNPIFVWPEKPADQQGMVFKVTNGDKTAIWVNTSFDQAANTVQYIYVIPDVVATVISLKLTPHEQSTQVAVTYERTALTGNANQLVRQMAARDRSSGPEWAKQINDHLKTRPQV